MLATKRLVRKLGRLRRMTGNRRRLLAEPMEERHMLAGISIIESGGNTVVTESGFTDAFAVSLTEAPTSDVVLSVQSSDASVATALPTSLTFTPRNWYTQQFVVVTGVNNTVRDGTRTTTIEVSVNDALSDDAFDRAADQFVPVTTLDDETGPPAPGTAIAVPDPQNPALQMLVVTGTSNNDTIGVRLRGGELTVRISAVLDRATFDSAEISRIEMFV